MTAPEKIAVKWTEEVAGYVDTRPVVRQTFTLQQLVDMILATTGKDAARVGEILRGGTCTYNIYRYWWEGFPLEESALATLLAEFPDADPARPFTKEACCSARLLDASEPMPHHITIEKAVAGSRRWFCRQSFWDALAAFAASKPPTYLDYSYYHHADIYAFTLTPRDLAELRAAAARLARRAVRVQLGRAIWVRLELLCPRM